MLKCAIFFKEVVCEICLSCFTFSLFHRSLAYTYVSNACRFPVGSHLLNFHKRYCLLWNLVIKWGLLLIVIMPFASSHVNSLSLNGHHVLWPSYLFIFIFQLSVWPYIISLNYMIIYIYIYISFLSPRNVAYSFLCPFWLSRMLILSPLCMWNLPESSWTLSSHFFVGPRRPNPFSSHPAYKNRRTSLEGGKMRKRRRIEKIGPKAHS